MLTIRYAELVSHPEADARRINEFLSGELDVAAMAATVDPALYRNRKNA